MKFKSLITKAWESHVVNSWVALAIKILGQLLVLPLVYKHFDQPEINLWLFLYSLLAINTVLDFGLTQTTARFVAYSRVGALKIINGPTKDFTLPDLVQGCRSIYGYISVVSLLLFTLGGIGLAVNPISYLKNEIQGWFSLGAFVVSGAVTLYGGQYIAILQGTENISEQKKVETVAILGMFFAQIFVIVGGGNIATLSLVTTIFVCVGVFCNRWLCFKNGLLRHTQEKNKLNKYLNKEILKASWRSGVGIATTTISYQMLGLLYAQIAPPEKSADIFLSQRLVMVIAQFANIPFYVHLSRLTIYYREGSFDKLINDARYRIFISCGIITVASFLVLLAKENLAVIGIQYHVDDAVWLTFCLGLFLDRLGAMHLQLYSITNDIRWHISNGITAIIMLMLIVILPKYYGVYGLVLSVPIAYGSFYLPYNMYLSYTKFHLAFKSFDSLSSFPWFMALLIVCLVTVFR